MDLEEVATVNNGSMEAKTVTKPTSVKLGQPQGSVGLEEVAKVKNGSMEAKTVAKPTKIWSASRRISGSRRGRGGQ